VTKEQSTPQTLPHCVNRSTTCYQRRNNNFSPIFSVMSHDGMNMMFVLVLLYRGEYDSRMFCGFKSRWTIPFVLSALNAAADNTHMHTCTYSTTSL